MFLIVSYKLHYKMIYMNWRITKFLSLLLCSNNAFSLTIYDNRHMCLKQRIVYDTRLISLKKKDTRRISFKQRIIYDSRHISLKQK